MRIFFCSLTRPKRVSKLHARLTGLKLGAAQDELAFVLGYSSWNELHQAAGVAVTQPSPDDEDLPPHELATRLEYQVTRLIRYRAHAGSPTLSRVAAERIIQEIRPSARSRNALARQNGAPTQNALPTELLSLLAEAEVVGGHKIHIKRGTRESSVWYRVHKRLVKGQPRTLAEVSDIFEWLSSKAQMSHNEDDTTMGFVRGLSPSTGQPVDLEFAWTDEADYAGARDIVIAIRPLNQARRLEEMGFLPDQVRLLQQATRGGGCCIVSGAANNGRHTTTRALTALDPEVTLHGEVSASLREPEQDLVQKTMRGIVLVQSMGAFAVATTLHWSLPASRWNELVRGDGPPLIISHQHLLPILCQNCRIPARKALAESKASEIKAAFGLGVDRMFVRNAQGCPNCADSPNGTTSSLGYQGHRVVAEVFDLRGAIARFFDRTRHSEVSAFRALRTAPYDSPDTTGKLAIEVAMYGVASGWFDIRDVENHIGRISWFLGVDPPEYPVSPEETV